MKDFKHDIVLLHGLWMTPLSWENWVNRFSEKGYRVLTPSWPGIEGRSVEEIRRHPEALRGLGINEILIHLEKILEQFDRQPIIMGHSFGGLFTQLLLDRGFGSCGVAINSAPVKGVYRLPFTTLRAAWPGIKNPLNVNGLVDFTFTEFNYAFTNGMPHEDALMAYDRYHIPAPNRPLLQVAFATFSPNAPTKVDFKNDRRAPLLLVSGGTDQITPVSMNKENYERYHSASRTEYIEFQGRNHYTIGQEGWEKLADYCLEWTLLQDFRSDKSTITYPRPESEHGSVFY